nr:uncharacterized protein LOC109402759 [Aedes albopictus]
MIGAPSSAAVQFVKKKKQFSKYPPKPGVGSNGTEAKRARNVPATPCWCCGAMHFSRDCTYKQYKCSDCGLIGHREGYCSSAKKSPKPPAFKRKGHPGAFSSKTVSLLVNTVNKKRRFVQARINGVDVRLQLDTGSDISIVSKQTWEKIGKPPKLPATERAATASGDPLQLLFKFESAITINGEQRQAQFYVVDKSLHLAGIDLLDTFGLWSVPISTYCNNITSHTTTIDSLKLLRPPAERSTMHNKDSNVKRSYQRDDPVFVKLYVNNNWHWAPGVVLEKVGNVMYNVWAENRRLVRSHINQMKDRNEPDHRTKAQAGNHAKLPINILLDAWNLSMPRSPTIPSHPLPPVGQTNPQTLASSTPNTNIRVSVQSPEMLSSLSAISSASSSSSAQVSASRAGSVTPDFQSAIEPQQVSEAPAPRRSSRPRRAPQRFQPYFRY